MSSTEKIKENIKNYKVPGRFEKHECTFITWPCEGDSELELFRKETKYIPQKYSGLL